MNNGFEIGEIAILVHTNHFHEYEGCECEIMSRLVPDSLIDMNRMTVSIGLGYKIELPDGMKMTAKPHQLKKKKEPEHDDAIIRETETQE